MPMNIVIQEQRKLLGLTQEAIQSHELIPVLLNGLETDPQCAYLREHPKFREIIDKYKNK